MTAANSNKEKGAHITSERSSASQSGLLEHVLNRFVRATFAVNLAREVFYRNEAAQKLLTRSGHIQIRKGRLQFQDRTIDRQIEDYLYDETKRVRSAVLRSTAGSAAHDPRVAYRVLLTPLYLAEHDPARQVWMLFISESNIERQIDVPVLQELYGLTRTESQLAAALFAGDALTAAAKSLDISINTAKTLLRRIFHKCEVQSQGELLQLLALGPRTL